MKKLKRVRTYADNVIFYHQDNQHKVVGWCVNLGRNSVTSSDGGVENKM